MSGPQQRESPSFHGLLRHDWEKLVHIQNRPHACGPLLGGRKNLGEKPQAHSNSAGRERELSTALTF